MNVTTDLPVSAHNMTETLTKFCIKVSGAIRCHSEDEYR